MLKNALERLKMSKTSEEIAGIYNGEHNSAESFNNFSEMEWFSKQEIQDKLKEAEKRIDEQITHKVEGSSVELIRKDNTKQNGMEYRH